jgi:glycosyltransferase involved in cell wall biosynthesis
MQRQLEADAGASLGDERPLAVIVINDFAGILGGTDGVAIAEAAGLARRGHRVTLIAGQGEPVPELIEAGVTVQGTGQHTTIGDPNRLRAAARGIWNRRSAAVVQEISGAADRGTTVVHIHGFTKVLSASVIRAAVQSGLPTVVTLHDYFAACPNGGFFNYHTNQICRLTPLSARCVATNCDARSYSHKLWRVGRAAVQRQFGAMPAGIGDFIAPSQSAAEILRPFLPPGQRVHILPNPLAVQRTRPVDVSQNDAFVFVGRLQPDKGPIVFARAARKAQVPAVFVGAGEEADAIRRAYPDAELTGWLEPEGVLSTVRTARAFVNASLWHESQGMSVLEAAAHGVPAIVPDSSVLKEVVADDVTGLWFRGGDVDDLAEKLTMLWRGPELAIRLGGAAYERFWSGDWNAESHLDRLERVYRAALRS